VSTKNQPQAGKETAQKGQAKKPNIQGLKILEEQVNLTPALQRARLDPRALAPRDVLQLQRAVGNQAISKLLAEKRSHDKGSDLPAKTIQKAAAEGVRTPGSKLPYRDQIQRSFGHHDISRVQAHIGSKATESANSMNALAYTAGDHIVFGGPADLHTVAHEAAHAVQQRSGIQVASGVGQVGDAYEQPMRPRQTSGRMRIWRQHFYGE
jgi:hypothetical protein